MVDETISPMANKIDQIIKEFGTEISFSAEAMQQFLQLKTACDQYESNQRDFLKDQEESKALVAQLNSRINDLQGILGELQAVHDGGGFRKIASKDKKADLEQDVTSVHPMIRTHPVTGRKALFVNSTFTKSIEGMHPGESQMLLAFLYDHIDKPEFACRFHWKKNSIAMWDNRCTQHRVLRDNVTDHRRMQRVTIEGDAPF